MSIVPLLLFCSLALVAGSLVLLLVAATLSLARPALMRAALDTLGTPEGATTLWSTGAGVALQWKKL